MSTYGLIKANSLIRRSDTIFDWKIVNDWRLSKGLLPAVPKGQSVRKLENSVALAIEGLDIFDLPKLTRSAEFYISILPEISLKERER
jgi:hypothetical protein